MIDPDKLFGRLGNRMFQMAYIYTDMRKGCVPDIYVQNYGYFDEYRNEIRQWYGSGIEKIDMVGVHVRRGDYVNNNFYVDLTETPYYFDAMALFPKEKFLIFSDDIEWCERQKLFKGQEFSKGKTDVEDMNLLAGCKGIIMANSSFSWWSAYLSSAKVIAPKEWFRDCVERTFIPDEWQRI
jgi:hypothetical protein